MLERLRLGVLHDLIVLPNEDPRKIIFVAVMLCLVGSVLVSASAVMLRPLQEHNATLAKRIEILRVAGLYEEGIDVNALFLQVETRIVDMERGEYSDALDADQYDVGKAMQDPDMSVSIPPDLDIARIKRRAKFIPVYLIRKNEQLEKVILPVHGYGLWSTLYGFLALSSDGRTIEGLTFYEHGETAGLGDQITNPKWVAQFQGKQAVDNRGIPAIRVIKGAVDPSSPEAKYQVDGLSGATLTSNGVTNLLRFWLGRMGFGPYLSKLRMQKG